MPPAARITDFHTCPLVNPGPVPHAGGPIITGCSTVLIEGLSAARVGDTCTCVGPLDSIASGSPTVLIGYRPAARLGDGTIHGGIVVAGAPTVIIGDVAGVNLPRPAPPTAWDKFQVWLWNIFHGEDREREAYSDGIVIEGSEQFRRTTRAALERIAALPSGSELLRQIDASGNEVVIGETTEQNGYCQANNGADARKPGVGTDSVVQWNPALQTTDPADPVSGTPGATVILAHELIHAAHNAQGTNANGPYDTYPPQSGASARGEERATVGAGGTSVVAPDGSVQAVTDHSADAPTENSIRDDLGLPRRPTYYPSNWPGGPPW